jgi:hypothetical protein
MRDYDERKMKNGAKYGYKRQCSMVYEFNVHKTTDSCKNNQDKSNDAKRFNELLHRVTSLDIC